MTTTENTRMTRKYKVTKTHSRTVDFGSRHRSEWEDYRNTNLHLNIMGVKDMPYFRMKAMSDAVTGMKKK